MAKKPVEQVPADEFWLVVADDVPVADVIDQCGVFDTTASALEAADECAEDAPQVIYHCKRVRCVSA